MMEFTYINGLFSSDISVRFSNKYCRYDFFSPPALVTDTLAS